MEHAHEPVVTAGPREANPSGPREANPSRPPAAGGLARAHGPRVPSVAAMRALQGAAGNRAVSRVYGATALPHAAPVSEPGPPPTPTTTEPGTPPRLAPSVQAAVDGEDDGLLAGLRRRLGGMSDALRSGWSSVSGLVDGAVSSVRAGAGSAVEALGALGEGVVSAVRVGWTTASTAVGAARSAAEQAIAAGVGGVVAAFGQVKAAMTALDADGLEAAWGAVSGTMAGAAQGALAAGRALAGQLAATWLGLQSGFDNQLAGAEQRAADLVGGLGSLAHTALDRAGAAWDGLRGQASGLSDILAGAPALVQRLARPLLAGAQSLWSGLQERWASARQTLSGLAEQVVDAGRQSWARASQTATAAFAGIRAGWGGVTSAASAAVDSVTSGVQSAWRRLSAASAGGLIGRLRRYVDTLHQVEALAANPDDALPPYAAPIEARLSGGMPGAADAEARTRIPQAGGSAAPGPRVPAAVQRQAVTTPPAADVGTTSSGAEIWAGLHAAFGEKWRQLDVRKAVVEALKTIIWPWPRIWDEIKGVGSDVLGAVRGLFAPRNLLLDPLGCLHDLWSDWMKTIDIPLAIWRRINNIALLLLGPITIALVIIGAVGGSLAGTVLGAIAGALAGLGIGAAPGAGGGLAVGGVAGAGAGLGVAIGVGEAFFISYVAGEAAEFFKVLADLFTVRQTRAEKAAEYGRAADSGLALGVAAVLAFLGWVGGRVAAVCLAALRRFVPASVLAVIDEFSSGVRTARTGGGGADHDDGPPPTDTPTVPDLRLPGPQTLTAGELGELQAIGDRYGTRIQVTGSRGAGLGRNVDTNLPVGKGVGSRSDIDVVIDGQVDIDSRGGLSNDIRNSCGGNTQIASSSGAAHGPHLDIDPHAGSSSEPGGSGGSAQDRPTVPPPARR